MDARGYTLIREGDLWVAELHENANKPSELEAALQHTQDAIHCGRGFVFMTNALDAPIPSLESRARFTRFMESHSEGLRRLCLGWAIVTDSLAMRVAHKAMGWFIPVTHPVKIFKTTVEARTWLQGKLDGR